jgi:Carboxypeptidase regulatory-like domain
LVIRFFALVSCLALVASAQEYAVVAGTVFRDNGFALAEAEVTLEVADAAPAPARKSKVKKLKTLSSPRGEFTFRVPPVAAKYRVTVAAKGFRMADKVVEVQGGSERVDATFTLSPESKH